MHGNVFERVLFSEASELADGGGAVVVDAPAAVAAVETPAAEAAPAAEVKPPSLLQQVHAAVKTKGAILAENLLFKGRAETAETALATVTAERDALQTRVTELEGERAEIETALTASQAANTTTEEAAAAQVAALGFEAAALPETVKAGESREELMAALKTEKDPGKRWEINEKLFAMG